MTLDTPWPRRHPREPGTHAGSPRDSRGPSLFGGRSCPRFLAPVFRWNPAFPGAEAHRFGNEKNRDKTTTHPAGGLGRVAYSNFPRLAAVLEIPAPPQPKSPRVSAASTAPSPQVYVDEIYNWALIVPLLAMSRNWLWKGVDQGFIDTVINDSADATAEAGGVLRRMQSGNCAPMPHG